MGTMLIGAVNPNRLGLEIPVTKLFRKGLTMTDTVSIKCAQCGTYDFKYERDSQDNLEPDDIVTCAGCGASAEYGVLIESAKNQIMDNIKASLGKSFK